MLAACALVVDPDEIVRRVLSSCLEGEGLEVYKAGTASEARSHLASRAFSLVMLDVELGQDDGLALARELRDAQDPAIVVVSAKADRDYRIATLNEVADDYIVKPFDIHELLARTRAVLRRRAVPVQVLHPGTQHRNGCNGDSALRFFGYILDTGSHRLTTPGGASVPLTATEFKLLQALVANPNRVFSRERLLELSGGNGSVAAYDRAIDMRIRRLREKLGTQEGSALGLIRTVRGVGYSFATPE